MSELALTLTACINKYGFMKPVVFLGPTLRPSEARQILKAEFLPPVRRSSLSKLTAGRLAAIVDGELSPDALLPDREVRDALRRGVVLYGSSSVGAYHASKFCNSGMHGVGWVYEQYRARRITGFDEISVLYHPLSLQALSVPLVNVRFWLSELVNAKIISSADATTAMKKVAQLDLHDRDFAGIKACLLRQPDSYLMQKELDAMTTFPEIKGDDARRLLRICARFVSRKAGSV